MAAYKPPSSELSGEPRLYSIDRAAMSGTNPDVAPADKPKPIAQYAASEGVNNIITAAANASGAAAWNDVSVQEMVLGPEQTQTVWKPEQLEKLECHKLPCWVTR